MAFERILGQGDAVRLFRQAVKNGRVSHAYVFLGPDGVGKTLFALEAAKVLLCAAGGCGECGPCHRVAHLTHPDLHVLEPLEGKREIGIDQARGLEEAFFRTPVEGRARVAVLRPADAMTEETANCLLKTLEEPPPNSLLILIVSNLARLLPTIVSRCQILRFRPLSTSTIRRILASKPGFAERGGEFAANCADGSAGRAVALLEANAAEERDGLVNALRTLSSDTGLDFAARVYENISKGTKPGEERRARVRPILDLALFYYRDLLAHKLQAEDARLYNADKADLIEEDAARLDEAALQEIISALFEARESIGLNANIPLVLEDAFLKIGHAQETAALRI